MNILIFVIYFPNFPYNLNGFTESTKIGTKNVEINNGFYIMECSTDKYW
jgi:hypothetical protein